MRKGMILAIAGLFLIGCGHEGKYVPGDSNPGDPVETSLAALVAVEGCDDLLDTLKDQAIADMMERVDQNLEMVLEGLESGYFYGGCYLEDAMYGGGRGVPTSANQGSSPPPSPGAKDYSTTNNQVSGVDEADFLKNDGKYIYIVADGKFQIIDAWPAADAERIASVDMEGTPKKLFVHKDRAVVYSSLGPVNQNNGGYDPYYDYYGGDHITYFWVADQHTEYGTYTYNAPEADFMGRWHHYAFLKPANGSGLRTKIYHDGVQYLQANNPDPNHFYTITGPMVSPGEGASWGGTFHGKMDDLALWDRLLTEEELQHLAAGNSPGGVDNTRPGAGSTYGIYFPTYPVQDSTNTVLTVTPDWFMDLPDSADYSEYFASNAALIDYGRAIGTGIPVGILWRRVQLLVPDAAADRDDVLAEAPTDVDDTTYNDHCTGVPAMTLPPKCFEDWWAYLARRCQSLDVAVYVGGNWLSDWSSAQNPTQTPTAVRVRFQLRGRDYEVICNIG